VCVWGGGVLVGGGLSVFICLVLCVYEVALYCDLVGTLLRHKTVALKLTTLWAFFCDKKETLGVYLISSLKNCLFIYACGVISLYNLRSAKNPRFASHREC
jgi:hypothetical protein